MSNTIYDKLDPKQLEAVQYGTGPLLIVAGPGSGKTRVITHRIAHLIHMRGIKPGYILATTFTNKAADEMRERLLQLIGWPAKRVWIGTVHGTCARLLRDCGPKYVGLNDNFTIYDPNKAGSVIGRVVKDLRPAALKAAKTLEDREVLTKITPANVLDEIGEAKEQGLHPNEYAKTCRDGRLIEPFYREYNLRLRESNAADFGDLQMHVVDMLSANPDLLDAVHRRFQYVLVDEYQDTNDIQAELFQLIAGGTKNITVVGDPDQSIYQFRHADPSHIIHFKDDWTDARTVLMGTNYRSTPNIINAASAVITNNPDRFSLEFKPVRAEGEPVRIASCRTEEETALLAARLVMAHYSQGVPLTEIAVLYRFHRSSRALESAFRLRSIPYTVVGGMPFYERREIADLLAWLGIIANPNDVEAFARAVRTPPRGVGNTTVEAVQKYAIENQLTLIEAARRASVIPKLRPQQRQGLAKMVELWDEFRARADEPELIVNIVNTIQYIAFLRAEEDDVTNRLLNVEELVKTYGAFCQQVLLMREKGEKIVEEDPNALIDVIRFQRLVEVKSEASPEERPPQTVIEMFMENIVLQKAEKEEGTEDKVRLSTIHSAKGTEFKMVIVIGCEQGTIPTFRSLGNDEAYEEERRVFYVAMTRAKDHLYLLHSREGLVFRDKPVTMAMESSEFLFEAMQGGAIEVRADDLPRPRDFGPIRVLSKGRTYRS